MSRPTLKKLWKSIIIRKIENQALCLEFSGRPGTEILREMASGVLSGDSSNVEAKAAAFYFPALFGGGFVRSSDTVENCALNYGYAIVRGIIARNLVVHGLEPCLGIFHHSELNQFNLADDIIEPFRPIVDLLVSGLNIDPEDRLTPNLKHKLFNLTNLVTVICNQKFRVNSAVGKTVTSLSNSIVADADCLELPKLLPTTDYRYV